MTHSTTVLDNHDAVLAALSPLRRDILLRLREPGSATSLARDLDLPRQKVNYHLRELERHGLVRLADEQQRRGLTERFFVTTADQILVDPQLLTEGSGAAVDDRYAAERLAATAARTVHDIGVLLRATAETDQRLATVTLDAEMTFATPQDLRDFVAEIGALVARFDRPNTPGGRRHRFVALSHPSITVEDQP